MVPVVTRMRPLARCHHRSGSSGGTPARLKVAVKRSQRRTTALLTRRSAPTTTGIRACNERVTGILHEVVIGARASPAGRTAAGPAYVASARAPGAADGAIPDRCRASIEERAELDRR